MTVVTYYGKEYQLEKVDGGWKIVGDGVTYTEPMVKKNINKAIKEFKERMVIRKANAPRCKVCKKDPTEISEYKFKADPIQFVLQNERFVDIKHFYCTSCYIKAGMPLF